MKQIVFIMFLLLLTGAWCQDLQRPFIPGFNATGDPTDHGMGWYMRSCQCSESNDACCKQECRHRYCLKKNMISSTAFPAECQPTVRALNNCRKEGTLPDANPSPTVNSSYFTVTTTIKETTNVIPIKSYRGINMPLKSSTKDKHTFYVYIDTDSAKIEQHHVDNLSSRTIYNEKYELDSQSCLYQIVKNEKVVHDLGGRDVLKSEDSGWGFEDDTRIYVALPKSTNEISFTWKELNNNGSYRENKKYKGEVPEVAKEILGGLANISANYINITNGSQEIEIFKRLFDYPGTNADGKCRGKVAIESLLMLPLRVEDSDIEFDIYIKPATKSEITSFIRNRNR